MTLDQVSHTHPPCGVAHPLASRISSPRSFLPRLSFSPSLSEDPDLPEFSRRHQKRHGHLDVQSQISHALADESEDRLRRRRDYRYTPLVPRRKPLPPPVLRLGVERRGEDERDRQERRAGLCAARLELGSTGRAGDKDVLREVSTERNTWGLTWRQEVETRVSRWRLKLAKYMGKQWVPRTIT